MERIVAGRYQLGEQLGVGGSSRVHAAIGERLGRVAAVKLLDARLVRSADPAGRIRFLREGRTSASFSHRNVVTVFDAGEDGDDLYIVMELVDGPSLATLLADGGRLPVAEATRIAGQVLAALGAAHAAGVVHRDIKPSNVLLDGQRQVKLADFGIAKRFDELEETVTMAGTVAGTPRYLAPERRMGAAGDAATDVFGVGVLLFEMLTGRTGPISDLASLRPDASPNLVAAIGRAASADPLERFASAAEMATALGSPWSPPAPIEDAAATVVMATGPAPIVGVRSGDTRIMPTSGHAAIAVPIRPSTPQSMAQGRRKRHLVVWFAIVVGLIVAGAAIANRGGGIASPDTSGHTTSTHPTSSSSRTTTVANVIPGFPATQSLSTFLLQLQRNPQLVGSSGPALANSLSDVLGQRSPKKRREAVTRLRASIKNWAANGTLDPAIARALDPMLAALVD